MIKCLCGTENHSLKNPKFWKDLDSYIGDCHGCGTSIHFVHKGEEIERAPTDADTFAKLREKLKNKPRLSA